ncbi:MAG: cache domain-containing protein [Deltaproteobacteria bacterium]|nr:cache domain-containing protein [Deltaproteobacteria bacterium]
MAKRILAFLSVMVVMSMFVAGMASADPREDSLALVKKGAEYLKNNGPEKAAEAFTKDEFKKGDLYLFAYDYTGTCLAQGASPQLVGKNLWNLKTPTGTYLIQDIIELSKKGGGWLEYQWMHDYKKKLMTKESYIMPVEGMDALIGCGFFKE